MLPRRSAVDHPAGRLQNVEAALQVDRHDAIELLLGVLQHRFADVDARRADDDVERAAVAPDFFECARHAGAVANVDGRGRRAAANLRRNGSRGCLVAVDGHNQRAELRRPDRHGFSDAGAGADDRRNLAAQGEDAAVGHRCLFFQIASRRETRQSGGLGRGANDGARHRLSRERADDRHIRLAGPAAGGEREIVSPSPFVCDG